MRAIITVLGKDNLGIIYNVTKIVSEHQDNILDISQTIVQEYFNMMMIVDMQKAEKEFGKMAGELEELGREIGVMVKVQHEDIFNKMHRV